MPIFRSHTTIEIARGLKAFLNLQAGLTRGPVPEEPDEQRAKQAQRRKKRKNRQLKRARERSSNQDLKRETHSGAKPAVSAEPAEVPQQQQLGALDAKSSKEVSGIEVGSVPARETLYLGHPFVYPYDSAIGGLIDRGYEWDAVLRTIVTELLPKEEPVICEVGSNIGASLLQILAVKPGARVVAFEPSAYFRPFLERNLELAGFDHVEVFPLLVGRNPGSMYLHRYDTTSASATGTNPPGYEPLGKELVEVTTLDEIFRDRGPVDFIKVDAEGFDFEVLRGAEATLERDRPILHFELEPRLLKLVPSEPVEGLGWLQSVGYRRFVCLDPAGPLIGTTDDPEQAIAWASTNANYDVSYCDVLTCPEGSASETRLGGIKFG